MNLKTKHLNYLAALSFLFLILGLMVPTLTIKKFFIFNDTYSIMGFTFALLSEGEFFLFLLVFIFSICFPVFKIMSLVLKINKKKYNKWIEKLGKWSLAEVFLAALFIFSIKAGGLGTALTLPGIYLFSASIALTAWISHYANNYENK